MKSRDRGGKPETAGAARSQIAEAFSAILRILVFIFSKINNISLKILSLVRVP